VASRKKRQPDSGDNKAQPQDSGPVAAPIKIVSIDALQPNVWNPNVEDPDTFNELVENIKLHGFTGAIEASPNEDGTFTIIGGEHRWKAAKLAGLRQVPVSIVAWDLDVQKIQSVKLNLLRGRLDPSKFTKLFHSLELKYGRERLRQLMGLGAKDAMFRQLLKEVKSTLPQSVQDQIEKRSDKIRNVEDLAAVVQSLYAQYGNTLEYNFCLFTYAGKVHLMIKMDKTTFEAVKELAAQCAGEGTDINAEVVRRLVG
jgi:ParB/RepB/Spo0J family partition protein